MNYYFSSYYRQHGWVEAEEAILKAERTLENVASAEAFHASIAAKRGIVRYAHPRGMVVNPKTRAMSRPGAASLATPG